MNELTLKTITEAINHNADLLERHLGEGVYVHRQETPSKNWAVTHSLGSLRPLIETYDSGGNRIGHAVNRESQTLNFTVTHNLNTLNIATVQVYDTTSGSQFPIGIDWSPATVNTLTLHPDILLPAEMTLRVIITA